MTTLLEEIHLRCPPELVAAREHGAIAALVSEGRTQVVQVLGGIGTVLETLGPVDGAAVLDTLDSLKGSNSAVKWAWFLIERGELDFGSTATRGMIDSLAAGGAMTQVQADALKAVAVKPAPVSVQAVVEAMEG